MLACDLWKLGTHRLKQSRHRCWIGEQEVVTGESRILLIRDADSVDPTRTVHSAGTQLAAAFLRGPTMGYAVRLQIESTPFVIDDWMYNH